jgi:hypothetical protein
MGLTVFVGLLGRVIGTTARPLPTHRATQTQKKCGQSYMPRVGFEPMILMFKRANTFHALDRAATVTCQET